MNLRPYQQRTLDELWGWFKNHGDGNPIVEACVGAGKSLMIAALAQRANAEFLGTRILVLVHQKELLEQNVDKLVRIWPQADVGVYSAAVGKKQLGRQITYATIGSIYKDAHKLGRVDIVLADECHLINPREVGMWRKFIADLTKYNPNTRIIGWTGTPFRGNGVWLTAEQDALFTHVAAKVTMKELVRDHFLVPLLPAKTETRIETRNVRIQNGDYVLSELSKAAIENDLVSRTCEEIVRIAKDRNRWLVFAVTIEHAEMVAGELERHGIDVDMVSSQTPKKERAELIEAFREGRLRCLVNVAVLTTGFDVPEVDFIALLRATKSPVLYVQIAGRGMRIADGKIDCLWADFTDTTLEMGPVDEVKGTPAKKKRDGQTPFKVCETCGSQNPTAALRCSSCFQPFPEPERINHRDEASGAAVMSSQRSDRVAKVPVTDVRYFKHQKFGELDKETPPTLRVEYFSGMLCAAREWVCLSHEGYARTKAESWWVSRSKIDAVPSSVDEAIVWLNYDRSILKQPTEVVINKSGKYPSILSYQWSENNGQDRVAQDA